MLDLETSARMTTLPFLPFAQPDIGDEEIQDVIATLRSGWLTTGQRARQFEVDFSDWLGDQRIESIAVNSATAGLHLALDAIGIGPGSEVITTTHTFTATAEVVRYLGGDPVLVDIEADSLCIDPALIERAITPRTRAIIPVHLGGRAANMEVILSIARRHGLRVIEDAAHALPTTHMQRLVGTLDSDATVFSFYANKTITTGEGGMVTTRDPEIAKRARVMRLHGINRDAFDRFTSKVPSWYYEVVAPGFKYNLTDIAASIGIQQLKKARAFQRRREWIAAQYDAAFEDLPLILPPRPQRGDTHAWHLYVIQLCPSIQLTRDEFIERMFALGIGMSVHYIPLHLQPYWRDTYRLSADMFPVSQAVYERTSSLPIHTRMSDADVERVISAVKETLR